MNSTSLELLETAMFILETHRTNPVFGGITTARKMIESVWMHEKFGKPHSEQALEKMAEMTTSALIFIAGLEAKR